MNWFFKFLFVILRPALGLIILAGLLLYWILKKKLPKEKLLKLVAYIFSGIIIFQSIFSTILNWWLWSQQGITQRLLPPHSPISYVLRYSWQHYWSESVITIFIATIVFFGIYFLNKKFEENLFYNEERYLAALGILSVGWPNCLIFLSLVLFLGILFHLIIISIIPLKDLLVKASDVVFRSHLQVERAWFSFFSRGGNNSLRKVSRRTNGQGLSEQSERENEAERQAVISSLGKSTASFRASYFRLSLLYFWLPCALLILLLGDIISKYIGINQFII